jgi:hypothetical protein
MKKVIAVLCIIQFIAVACGDNKDKVLGSNDNAVISIVKQGHFSGHIAPERNIGQAVDNFFGNPRWMSLIGEDGKTYVNLTGKMRFLDEEVDALVQFQVDVEAGTFELNAFEMNDIPQNNIMKLGLIEALYEED